MAICESVQLPPMDIWVVCSLELLWTVLLWIFLYVSLMNICVHFYGVCVWKWNCWVTTYTWLILYYQIVFQSYTNLMLHFYSGSVSLPTLNSKSFSILPFGWVHSGIAILALICISLMTSEGEFFLMYLLTIGYSLLWGTQVFHLFF